MKKSKYRRHTTFKMYSTRGTSGAGAGEVEIEIEQTGKEGTKKAIEKGIQGPGS
jgi:hypothetical protein